MKCCDKCEHYFELPAPGSPCEKCLTVKWGERYRRATIPTRIEILKTRLKMILAR